MVGVVWCGVAWYGVVLRALLTASTTLSHASTAIHLLGGGVVCSPATVTLKMIDDSDTVVANLATKVPNEGHCEVLVPGDLPPKPYV